MKEGQFDIKVKEAIESHIVQLSRRYPCFEVDAHGLKVTEPTFCSEEMIDNPSSHTEFNIQSAQESC